MNEDPRWLRILDATLATALAALLAIGVLAAIMVLVAGVAA